MTVVQLIIQTIKHVYLNLQKTGAIPKLTDDEAFRHENIYADLCTGVMNGFMLQVAAFNINKLNAEKAKMLEDKLELDKEMRHRCKHNRGKEEC